MKIFLEDFSVNGPNGEVEGSTGAEGERPPNRTGGEEHRWATGDLDNSFSNDQYNVLSAPACLPVVYKSARYKKGEWLWLWVCTNMKRPLFEHWFELAHSVSNAEASLPQ